MTVPRRDPLSPWPETTEHGERGIGPYDHCHVCGAGAWVRYGDQVTCLVHALEQSTDPERQPKRAAEPT